jgi:peptidoglycan/LPS O-acetylase OafA/YrhL
MMSVADFETKPPTRRLTALDSVRGVAAFIVVLSHCCLTLPDAAWSQLDRSVWSRPIRLFTNGDAAVIIFFVLSGYVLALPFFRGAQPSYPRYLFKRICRIYIPFAVTISIAALLCQAVNVRQCLAGASNWLDWSFGEWVRPGPSALFGHFMMTGMKQDIALDPVMWSLVYEMRISLIFPVLMILCWDTRLALLVTAVTLAGSTTILAAFPEAAHPTAIKNFWFTILWTVRIAPYFMVGILLSHHSEAIRRVIRYIPARIRLTLMAVPIVIFTIPHHFLSVRSGSLYVIGAAMVIVLAVEIPSISAILHRAPIPWLGRISYSLYLIHLPILLALFYTLSGNVPSVFIIIAVLITSLIMATLMHHFVEVPAIKLGQRVARSPRSTARSQPWKAAHAGRVSDEAT